MRGKKEKGITLIALIITIIVMLILVAVTVTTAINGGIFKKAGEAVSKTDESITNEKEKVDELLAEWDKENSGEGKPDTPIDPDDEYNQDEPSNQDEVKAGERAEKTLPYNDGEGGTATIPREFTVSGLEEENKIEDGLVIYLIPKDDEDEVDWKNKEWVEKAKKTYDQFVWIPIKQTTDPNEQDINDMYICQGKTENNGECQITVEDGKAVCKTVAHSTETEDGTNKNELMAGRLYASKVGEYFENGNTKVYTEGSGLREPDTVSRYDGNAEYLTQMNEILETSFQNANDFKTYLQREYNKIVASVYTYKGFYVGRYETSNMKDDSTNPTVKVVAGTTNGINTVTWYRMYAEQVNYAKNNKLTSVGSSMIQGAAYDQEMKFVNVEEKYNVKKAINVGHDFASVYQTCGLNYPSTTSVEYKDYSKNIYDLEGNVRTWTTEAVKIEIGSDTFRVWRRRNIRY